MNFHPGHCDDKRIRKEIKCDEELANHRDLDAISPATEPVTNYRESSEFEQRRNPVPKKGLVLRAHAIGHALASKVSTNHFKHNVNFWLELFDVAESLETLLDLG